MGQINDLFVIVLCNDCAFIEYLDLKFPTGLLVL